LTEAASKRGAIVQHVNISSDILDPTNKQRFIGNYDLWEKWTVRKGKTTPVESGGNYHDALRWAPKANPSTKGVISITANADFYPDQKPEGFKVDRSTPAGEVPMRISDPGLAGGTGAIPRKITGQWDCRAESPDRKTKVEREPQ
jgi:hypothetical protein